MDSVDPADIPVVILAGGEGTRIREVSETLPKPMIDIGGKPILWHIIKTYGHYGHRRFVVLLGFKSWLIKDYFLRYRENLSDFTTNLQTGEINFHGEYGKENFVITMVYTGLHTETGGRLSRARQHIEDRHGHSSPSNVALWRTQDRRHSRRRLRRKARPQHRCRERRILHVQPNVSRLPV